MAAKPKETPQKPLESWIWDAACSIRGAKDAPKYKDYLLLIFTKRLCDVFDDELNRIAKEVGSRKKAFQLAEMDWQKAKPGKDSKKQAMVRFFIPLKPEDREGGTIPWLNSTKIHDRFITEADQFVTVGRLCPARRLKKGEEAFLPPCARKTGPGMSALL